MTLEEQVAKMDGINLNYIGQDINKFVTGRNAGLRTIKRWIVTRNDAREKEIMADYLLSKIRNHLLDYET